jgi:hypothetical protein
MFSIQPLDRASRPCQAPPLAAERSSFWPNVLTAELVAANRAPEKKLSVVPSLDLVVTRLGKLPGPAIQPTFPSELWKPRRPGTATTRESLEAGSEHRNTR